MDKTCTPEELPKVMGQVLEGYNLEVIKVTNDAINKTARQSVRELRSGSPKKSGKYSRSWKIQRAKDELGSIGVVIYNKEYQLTHLLEKGHKMWFDETKRADARPHIKEVADSVGKKVEHFFISGLGRMK